MMPAGSGHQRYAGTPPQTRRYSDVAVHADQNGELEQHVTSALSTQPLQDAPTISINNWPNIRTEPLTWQRQHISTPYSAIPPRSISPHRVSISSLPDTLSRSTPPVLGGSFW
ncbi:hypothetical protein DICSQDRAFT_138220 [Dichomitus squalens LYAD-421 SS1]|uniref:Uncharacterized protein n=1 Tax=Dichomitus squalens (strain LYAD-421) TaxID=732165 RepID=R7SU73_DICSQ|nr:uncharacterized protein DICSQDRAFT_138220 [Dichomitus squalens LYAD-421 SS1]EJF59759.1 hypothetical protein DICSQDRAFT_138220 [Dichomitus squalens LYAD-421 SS1]